MAAGRKNKATIYKRKITNEDVQKYDDMIEMFIRKSVIKNWREASVGKNLQHEASLGNTGMSLEDIRQHLKVELCVALSKYNPDFKTKDNKSVQESTFVYNHLNWRVGGKMKQLANPNSGYGVWHQNYEETFDDIGSED